MKPTYGVRIYQERQPRTSATDYGDIPRLYVDSTTTMKLGRTRERCGGKALVSSSSALVECAEAMRNKRYPAGALIRPSRSKETVHQWHVVGHKVYSIPSTSRPRTECLIGFSTLDLVPERVLRPSRQPLLITDERGSVPDTALYYIPAARSRLRRGILSCIVVSRELDCALVKRTGRREDRKQGCKLRFTYRAPRMK